LGMPLHDALSPPNEDWQDWQEAHEFCSVIFILSFLHRHPAKACFATLL